MRSVSTPSSTNRRSADGSDLCVKSAGRCARTIANRRNLPRGSRPLRESQRHGAGIHRLFSERKFVACMPGVPREMKPMLVEQVIPFLRERLGSGEAIYTRVLHTIGIGESEIDHRIDDLFRACGESEDRRARARLSRRRQDHGEGRSREEAEAMIAPLETEIEQRLGGCVFGRDEQTPASAIHALLAGAPSDDSRSRNRAPADVSRRALTSVPGASQSFSGGVVAYANSVKIAQLGVNAKRSSGTARSAKRLHVRWHAGRAAGSRPTSRSRRPASPARTAVRRRNPSASCGSRSTTARHRDGKPCVT